MELVCKWPCVWLRHCFYQFDQNASFCCESNSFWNAYARGNQGLLWHPEISRGTITSTETKQTPASTNREDNADGFSISKMSAVNQNWVSLQYIMGLLCRNAVNPDMMFISSHITVKVSQSPILWIRKMIINTQLSPMLRGCGFLDRGYKMPLCRAHACTYYMSWRKLH